MSETQKPRGTPGDLLRDLASPEGQEHIRAVLAVSDSVLIHLDAEEMLRELLERLRSVTAADTATVLLRTAGGDALRVRASVGLEAAAVDGVTIPFGEGIAGAVAREKRPIVVEDVAGVQVVSPALRKLRSLMAAPLLVRGEVTGVLQVGSLSGRSFSDADLDLLTRVAGRVAIAVERARLLEETRREVAERGAAEAALRSATERLTRALTRDEVARAVVTAGMEALDALTGTFGVVAAVDGGAVLEIVLVEGVDRVPGEWRRVPAAAITPITDAVRQRRGVHVTEAERTERYPALEESRRASGSGAMSAVPLEADGRVLGVLGFAFPAGREVAAADRDLIDALGQLSARALERAQLYEAERAARRRMEVLSEAGRILSSSLSMEEIYESLTRFAIRTLADYSVVYLLDVRGESLRRAAMAHVDPDGAALMERLLHSAPPPLSMRSGAGRVVLTGEPVFAADIRPEDLEQSAHDVGHLELIRRLRPRSTILVPLRARGRTSGVLAVVTVEGGRPGFEPADVALIEELARRAALAADNARLFEEAQAASLAKGRFLATMSHELRTPLNAVVGYTDLVESGVAGPINERQRGYLGRIRVSTRLLIQIIGDILSYSRLEAGREGVEEVPVSLPRVVEEAVLVVQPAADRKGVPIVVAPGSPVEIVTDPGKVRQIVVNLLSNAVKFTDGGQVEVSVADAGDRVVVEVRDTGQGIAPEDIPRIWEPFTQLDQSTTREQGGTGLGLTVSRRMARLLGGEIHVLSVPGEGTTFSLELPRSGPDPAP